MEYALFFVGLAVAAGATFAATRFTKEKLNNLFGRLLIIPLAVFFVIRFFSVNRKAFLDGFIKLEYYKVGDVQSLFGISGTAAVFALIATWFSVASFLLLAIRPFFNLKTTHILSKYFPIISAIASIILIKEIYVITANAEYGASLYSVALSLEAGYSAGLSIGLIVSDAASGYYARLRFDKKQFFTALAILFAMLLVTVPTYFIQSTYGYTYRRLKVIDISSTHRAFLYLTFALPFVIYFALRNKPENVIRASMIYLTVATMISYSETYDFSQFGDLTAWPFHLCNTAMYVVPICLIFKLKRVFYFTYFINVLGALFAMLMPNYNENANPFSWSIMHFWMNHACAFFYPLLCVALKLFPKPNKKYFTFSMLFFFVYFVFVLILNAYFTAHGHKTDFFFINSDFIADKLGTWAKQIFIMTAEIPIGEYTYVFHPLYQILYFFVYVLLGIAVWFVYSLFFNIAASHYAIYERRKKIRLDKFALLSKLDGRSIDQPMNINAGIKLELKNFSKRYDVSKEYAVKDASFSVYGGEIFGFLGPNGAGKSTIIKSIVGIQPITEGSIEVCGYDCALQPVESKKLIGYVPDHYALYEKLTGREYINYIADIYEVGEKERDERIDNYVKLFELEHAIDTQIRTYSHGMKQKIAIMAALVHDPKLWILDEPLTGLDPNSIFQVKECMRRHAERGNIVFFSSHIIEVVEKLCSRITIIKKGSIQCTKTIEEIEKDCSLEEFYLKTIGADEIINREKELGMIKGEQALTDVNVFNFDTEEKPSEIDKSDEPNLSAKADNKEKKKTKPAKAKKEKKDGNETLGETKNRDFTLDFNGKLKKKQ